MQVMLDWKKHEANVKALNSSSNNNNTENDKSKDIYVDAAVTVDKSNDVQKLNTNNIHNKDINVCSDDMADDMRNTKTRPAKRRVSA